MKEYQKPIAVIIFCLIFTTLFIRNVKNDFPLIFSKDLLAHDESSNSVVAANVTRKFFPPMVRVNPLVENQGNWMEGPYWQHIPPLFAYVPYIFFQLDGQVTIEVKRLSFAFVTLLTGLLFIFGVYNYRKSLLAALAATTAAIFWINTPFTRELITGYAFGVSDIVLAFTVVASFVAILWYLRAEREERRGYSYWKLAVIAFIVATPILAKNLLGAIPAATFLGLLVFDHRALNKKVVFSATVFISVVFAYMFSLYLSSSETFKKEVLVSFSHFSQLEGWARPWHWYLTNYLPQRYLFGWTWVFYIGLTLAIGLRIRDLKYKSLWLSGIWFIWNLVAISLVTSKVPNFIYQSYLLCLFFIVYSLILLVTTPDSIRGPLLLLKPKDNRVTGWILGTVLITCVLVTGNELVQFVQQFKLQRALAYNYSSEREKFYGAAEAMRSAGVNSKDLVIVHVSDNDCWARYPIIFLTGAEAKTFLEMHFITITYESIKQKYPKIYFLDKNYSFLEFDIATLESLLDQNKDEIQKHISRIKVDKTSCQWLVPDEILNAQ